MKNIKTRAGFAKLDITPPLGVCLEGYYHKRQADDILDPLYVFALAISNGTNTIIIISCDLIGMGDEYADKARELIGEKLSIPKCNIMIHCTHTHTGPIFNDAFQYRGRFAIGEKDLPYIDMVLRKICDAAYLATNKMQNAIIEIGYGSEESISFIRRFKMKDGTIKTNPGMYNPEINEPIGRINPIVGVIRMRLADDARDIFIVNFALHPDIIGGTGISADYPGHMRRTIKKQFPNSDVVFLNGAAGDINHIDFMHPGSTWGGYEYSEKVGKILAMEVLKVVQRMDECVGDMDVKAMNKNLDIELRHVSQKQGDAALETLKSYHNNRGGDKEKTGMEAVADIAEAYQTMSIIEGPEVENMEIQVLAFGDIAFAGLPGEVFSDIGCKIQEKSPFKYTFIVSLANGSKGYFPTKTAFEEGGYEARNNPFTPRLEDDLIDGFRKVFKEI